MKALIPLVYPAHPNDEQQEQWRNASRAFSHRNDWHISLYEEVDDNNNVHQVAFINDSPQENIHIRALRFLRAFKAFAPFVACGKPVFAEKLDKQLYLRLFE